MLMVLAGCAGTASQQLYLLDAQSELPDAHAVLTSPVTLGLGPIRLPTYLDRPQMVVALGDHQYQLDEQHRWAERLDENITRSLLQALNQLLPGVQIVRHPWGQRQAIDLQLQVDILEFHHYQAGYSQLQAQWRLSDPSQTQSASQIFNCRIDADNDRPEMIVAAQSRCLSRFSLAIDAQVRRIVRQKNTPAVSQ